MKKNVLLSVNDLVAGTIICCAEIAKKQRQSTNVIKS